MTTTSNGNGDGGRGRSAKMPTEMTPLEMCRNLTRHVAAFALAADEDPLGAHVARLGDRQHATAELAARLALVSIAEDVHRLTDAIMDGRLLGGSKSPWD
jgi:hypothetical protein